MWVKGSGGDLATLTESGLAVLRLDRMRALAGVYEGPEHEDEMVAAMDFCLHGRGGAAPSIDTAMHGLVRGPTSTTCTPTAASPSPRARTGRRLTKKIYGDKVLWVPWRRPGFQLGLDIAALQQEHPEAIGVILGGHGITAWGDSSAEAEANSLWIIGQAQAYIDAQRVPDPFGPQLTGPPPLGRIRRGAGAAALAPHLRAVASRTAPVIGHFCDDATSCSSSWPGRSSSGWRGLGTSCPDHFLRTKVRPLVLDLPPSRGASTPTSSVSARSTRSTGPSTRPTTAPRRPEVAAHARGGSGHHPGPGVGMFAFGKDKQTARVSGEFYVNAINVMRGAEAISTYSPIDESEKFRIEYWELEEAKLRRLPRPRSHDGRIALVTGGAGGIGAAIAGALAARGACVVVADLDLEKPPGRRPSWARRTSPSASRPTSTDERVVRAAIEAALLAFGGIDLVVNNAGLSISKPLLETTEEDWDLQHDVMAKGSSWWPRPRPRRWSTQGLGGDIVYICSKNAVFAGPNNIAYGAAKADQAHQVRLLAAELGEHGIRVNGINPDGSSGRGSSPAAGAPTAPPSTASPRTSWAPSTRNARCSSAKCCPSTSPMRRRSASPQFGHTTGTIVPVDSGVAAAFLR